MWDLGLFRLSSTSLIVLIAGIGLGLGIIFWLRRSKQGLALRAIGVDSETAAGMGINQFFLSIGTMAVAGGLAGLAGALLTIQLRAIRPRDRRPTDHQGLRDHRARGGTRSMTGASSVRSSWPPSKPSYSRPTSAAGSTRCRSG